MWAGVWGVASNPGEPLGKEALVGTSCKGVPRTVPSSKSLAGTTGRSRHPKSVVTMGGTFHIYSLSPPPPPSPVMVAPTLSMRGHTQAIGHSGKNGRWWWIQMSELRPTSQHTVCFVETHREPQVARGTCLERVFFSAQACVTCIYQKWTCRPLPQCLRPGSAFLICLVI